MKTIINKNFNAMGRWTFSILIFALFLMSCNEDDDCGEIDCTTPPVTFWFDIVDSTTGENVFDNGTYARSDIDLTDTLSDEPVAYNFITVNERNLIEITSVGEETEVVNIEVSLVGESIFQFYVDAERKTEDCCNFTEYNEIELTGANFELDNETGIYRVFID